MKKVVNINFKDSVGKLSLTSNCFSICSVGKDFCRKVCENMVHVGEKKNLFYLFEEMKITSSRRTIVIVYDANQEYEIKLPLSVNEVIEIKRDGARIILKFDQPHHFFNNQNKEYLSRIFNSPLNFVHDKKKVQQIPIKDIEFVSDDELAVLCPLSVTPQKRNCGFVLINPISSPAALCKLLSANASPYFNFTYDADTCNVSISSTSVSPKTVYGDELSNICFGYGSSFESFVPVDIRQGNYETPEELAQEINESLNVFNFEEAQEVVFQKEGQQYKFNIESGCYKCLCCLCNCINYNLLSFQTECFLKDNKVIFQSLLPFNIRFTNKVAKALRVPTQMLGRNIYESGDVLKAKRIKGRYDTRVENGKNFRETGRHGVCERKGKVRVGRRRSRLSRRSDVRRYWRRNRSKIF